jgi:hypothetical protein
VAGRGSRTFGDQHLYTHGAMQLNIAQRVSPMTMLRTPAIARLGSGLRSIRRFVSMAAPSSVQAPAKRSLEVSRPTKQRQRAVHGAFCLAWWGASDAGSYRAAGALPMVGRRCDWQAGHACVKRSNSRTIHEAAVTSPRAAGRSSTPALQCSHNLVALPVQELAFDNTFVRELPADPEAGNSLRQVRWLGSRQCLGCRHQSAEGLPCSDNVKVIGGPLGQHSG